MLPPTDAPPGAWIQLPKRALVHRLVRDRDHVDALLSLLYTVVGGYRFTNRLNEAVVLVHEDVLTAIRQTLDSPCGMPRLQETR